ncbi:hypothetical protein BIW11_07055 [Tropilaelaps mercedesae]|uniref:UPF0547 domain-containing protein n=1 Tax=Tropilaelaps mercedesae TaxID=418985 RepID=A0A1V9XVM9_9ACAR|nr:hypothetical protein BIW11_07055 [Tropilaelaps mercedesae]
MAKNKTMIKKCPQCENEVATATKLCPCGFSFFEKRKSSRASEEVTAEVSRLSGSEGARRRGVRVRKETQTYGTTVPSSTLDTKIRSPKGVAASGSGGTKKRRGTGGKDSPAAAAAAAQDEDTNSEEGAKRKRGRKGRDERFQEQEEKLLARITSAQAKRHALILSHINYTIRRGCFHQEVNDITSRQKKNANHEVIINTDASS